MKIPRLEQPNNPQFLEKAFDEKERKALLHGAALRRNIYVGFFLAGIVCIFAASLMYQYLLSILALFLSTLSLVVITKYDTQLCFLRILDDKKRRQADEDEERSREMSGDEESPEKA